VQRGLSCRRRRCQRARDGCVDRAGSQQRTLQQAFEKCPVVDLGGEHDARRVERIVKTERTGCAHRRTVATKFQRIQRQRTVHEPPID
jgi:hypothetical protein